MGAEYSAEWFCTVENGWSRACPVLRIRILLIARRGVEICFRTLVPREPFRLLSFAKVLRGNGGSASFPSHKACPRTFLWVHGAQKAPSPGSVGAIDPAKFK